MAEALFGLIGRPIGHSRSAELFSERFARMGLNARYELFELDAITDLHELIATHPTLIGLNVTSPYKQEVLAQCTQLSPEVEAIGAANTLLITRSSHHPEDYTLSAYNTDAHGFAVSLQTLSPQLPHSALILGTGGAARAVAYALEQLAIRYRVVSRRAQAGRLSYEELSEHLDTVDLIVQATPIGYGIEESLPFPYERLNARHLCYDLIYTPSPTQFMRRALAHGARVCDGLSMLHLQAQRAWEIWSGFLPHSI